MERLHDISDRGCIDRGRECAVRHVSIKCINMSSSYLHYETEDCRKDSMVGPLPHGPVQRIDSICFPMKLALHHGLLFFGSSHCGSLLVGCLVRLCWLICGHFTWNRYLNNKQQPRPSLNYSQESADEKGLFLLLAPTCAADKNVANTLAR